MKTQAQLRKILTRKGLPGLVEALNADVPYRFTGIFVRDGMLLRNLALFDKTTAAPPLWQPFPLSDSFCSLVLDAGVPLIVERAGQDDRPEVCKHRAAAIVQSYCGIPVFDADGDVIGSLCHFDYVPIANQVDLEQLLQATPLMAPYLGGKN